MARRGESDEAISIALANLYGVTVSRRTIGYRLVEWGISRPAQPQRIRSSEEEILDRLVMQLYKMSLSSDGVLRVLHKQGYTMSERTLRRIRKRLGISLRCTDPDVRERQIDEIREILLVEDAIGEIEGFGRRLQYLFLRSQGAFFPRDLIFEVYRSVCLRPLDGLSKAFSDLLMQDDTPRGY